MDRIKLILIAFVLIASISVASATDVGGPITADKTWNVTGSPYNVTSNVIVKNYATLTIDPGVVVNFSEGKLLRIRGGGKLLAEGTSEKKITFTGTTKAPGHWKGIIFRPLSDDTSVIDNAIIEYGGHAWWDKNDHEWRSANIMTCCAAPTITNSTIRNSKGDGILCIGRSLVSGSTSTPTVACCWKDPMITCNWITNNTNGVHTIARAKPTINYNNICGNFVYGVRNDASVEVDATYNWWGSATGPTGTTGDAVFGNVDYDLYLTDESPCAPIPELSSIILVAAGLLMLAGYVRIGRRD